MLGIFLLSQVLDGVLTYIGVSRLGIDVEMNAWLASAMQAVGPAPALLSAKTVSCLCGAFLYLTASYRPLAVAAGLHLGFAVVPWIVIVALFV